MQVTLPVGWHPAGRAGRGLGDRMVLGRCQVRPVVELLGGIAPEPVFPGSKLRIMACPVVRAWWLAC